MNRPEERVERRDQTATTLSRIGTRLPRRCTIEGFVEDAGRPGGLSLASLPPLACLRVQTRNTLYRIVVVRPPRPEILVQGGQFFVARTAAQLCGCSFGGSFLKLAWIGVEMSMEIHHEGRRIVTSPVRSIEVQPESTAPPV